MEPITAIILNKGNNLHDTLDSINNLQLEQVIVGTFSPLKVNYKAIIVDLKNESNYSASLNELQALAKTDWILYLKDNERLLQFNEYMPNLTIKPKEIYGFQILQEEVIIKESRLWNKEQKIIFKNPVFEKPNIDPTQVIDVMLYQQKTQDPNINKSLELWKRTMPLSVDANYYKAFASLSQRNFVEFKRVINHYLFSVKRADIPSVMARYYLALVQGVVGDETKEAIKNIVTCLVENPLMAEFWCLLGDIFTKIGKFKHAIAFYENATILGCRRQHLDLWPMHISKYGDYPKEMIEKCKKAVAGTETYQTNH